MVWYLISGGNIAFLYSGNNVQYERSFDWTITLRSSTAMKIWMFPQYVRRDTYYAASETAKPNPTIQPASNEERELNYL